MPLSSSLPTLPAFPIYAYSRARSAGFALESLLLHSIERLIPGKKANPRRAAVSLPTLLAVRQDLCALLRQDAENIHQGLYPLSVLRPESPIAHLRRMPHLILDGFRITRRRMRGRTTEFDLKAKEWLEELPRYYRRNFHFQTSGYLSERSAEVYEHQVEILFKGSADAMRRLILKPLTDRFKKKSPDGEGLKFLEIGAGTGRATRFVRLAFPKAKIVAVDLSDPYLKIAQRQLMEFPRIDFLQADGANLPFQAGEFDAVYSVFLFHELPETARTAVLAESRRVLKSRGFLGLVDSIQNGDKVLFNPLLQEFPRHFHEPFYRDYIAKPIEGLMTQDAGVKTPRTTLGFSSKVCWGLVSPGSTA